MGRTACTEPQCLYNGYRVFPGGKERPGRDADPSLLLVSWSRKSTAIHLLPIWAVRPVQSLSACTRVTFTLTSLTHITIQSYFKYCNYKSKLSVWLSETISMAKWNSLGSHSSKSVARYISAVTSKQKCERNKVLWKIEFRKTYLSLKIYNTGGIVNILGGGSTDYSE